MLKIFVKHVNLIQVSLKSDKNNRPRSTEDLRSSTLSRSLRDEY